MDEESQSARPITPEARKTKRGVVQIPASAPKEWVIGARIGRALRDAQGQESTDPGGTHASPRGHWHTFLMGAGKSERKLRRLPPIPVNIKSVDDLPVTVHPVGQ